MTRDGRPRVFVSGPMSQGHRGTNLRNAIKAADRLLDIGCDPHIPHLTWMWDDLSPHHYETWMALDFGWIEACDAVLRLPGESPGSERECYHAETVGIPVFDDIGELAERFGLPL